MATDTNKGQLLRLRESGGECNPSRLPVTRGSLLLSPDTRVRIGARREETAITYEPMSTP